MAEIRRIFDLLDLYREEYRSMPAAFSIKRAGKWISYSAHDYLDYSSRISLGLLSMGVTKGTKIATIMVNCPEWNFFDMGILQAGAVHVPIYPTISEENYRYILKDASVEYVIVSNLETYNRIRSVLKETPSVKGVFSISNTSGIRHWKEIAYAGDSLNNPSLLEEIKQLIAPGDLATIIYTSGTTGRPKGVMLSHKNIISNFLACAEIPDFKINDRALSFLPLCHVYERMLNYVYQYLGMSVWYAESLDKLIENIKDVRPHTFATVPRVLEKIYNRMIARARNKSLIPKLLFFWALRLGVQYDLNHAKGWIYDVKIRIADQLVFRKWRKALGNNIKLIVSGGASLHPKLARLFWAARLYIMEGYGLTETAPVIAVYNFKPGGVKFGTVGTVLPGVEVKIAEDGEILCKGPNVMLGYHNRPERTEEVMDRDGWFHTGDIGLLEDGKYLKITDRKKEIFKTSTGRYIAPQVIEMKFKESPFIENIMVIGENRKYTAALIVPNFEYLQNWCEIKGIRFTSKERAIKNIRVIRRIKEEVKRYNKDLGQTEKIKKFRLLTDEWSSATGELSPTLKPRRKFILEKYHHEIEETYRSSEFNYRTGLDQ
jgi:long-chain acyl-CoA synthetase